MALDHKGRAVVIIGVSGAGKSTIGDMLAKVLKCSFLDADDFHPLSNKEKMSQGIPLSDEDRVPWLETLRDALKDKLEDGKTVILGCSSLQKHYREILRSADANYVHGSYVSRVQFVLLDVEANVLVARLEKRAAEGKHFMPVGLLQSQLELLRIDEGEGIFKVDATLSPLVIIGTVAFLTLTGLLIFILLFLAATVSLHALIRNSVFWHYNPCFSAVSCPLNRFGIKMFQCHECILTGCLVEWKSGSMGFAKHSLRMT